MVHLCSKEGEWNMLDVVEGEGLDGADNRGLLSEATKARCRAELMEVSPHKIRIVLQIMQV